MEQTVTTYTHKVTALNGLFLRTGPTVNFPKLGLMPYGTPLRVTSTDALGWHKIDLATNVTVSAKMNGTDLLQYNPQSPVSYGYCSAYYTEPWAPPPPPPPLWARSRKRPSRASARLHKRRASTCGTAPR